MNGRQVSYKYLDDAYNPAQTVPLTKQLVEQDQVFLTFGGLGTQAQTSVREYLNGKKVPQVIVATGATTFAAEFEKYPYTFGWQPVYQGESLIYAQYILKNTPNAKIGVIYQNDDYGQDYLDGLTKGLGSKAAETMDMAGFRTLLARAVRHGRPTMIQLVLFASYWVFPAGFRGAIRSKLALPCG